jgi:hypothetical protein
LKTLLIETPWERIVHWYGRASAFLAQVRQIAAGEAEPHIYDEISQNIKHQDGVMQASPIMTKVLIELLYEAKSDKFRILEILKQVYDATKWLVAFPIESAETALEDELWRHLLIVRMKMMPFGRNSLETIFLTINFAPMKPF